MRNLSDIVFNQNPLTMPVVATVKEACHAMHTLRVGSVLVTDAAGHLVGIFTGRDAVCRVLARGRSAANTRLSDVMTANPDTMSPAHSAVDAMRMMWDGGFRHVPVVEAGRIIGVVSHGDFRAEEHDCLDAQRNLWEHVR